MAAFMALQHEPPLPIWSLDKANVLASSRLWRKTVEETIKNEFPTLKVQHQLIDSAAMILVKNPTHLNGIIITSNMFGDIISDEASVIPGSLGFVAICVLGLFARQEHRIWFVRTMPRFCSRFAKE
ncbi:Leu2p [Saccharomyces cerevisiae CEN.PK113-7D]|uniref:3-isopropylmalate dehydrogenase n=1 Tax=Saccharomyces cerevisiae (strain CEN.PK113-7D) TaxID=889517 RepID=N1P992_YEASC|nr:Leu2p [Saccharomyces cerevisiae CEN.PK113-7D]